MANKLLVFVVFFFCKAVSSFSLQDPPICAHTVTSQNKGMLYGALSLTL